MKNLEQRLLQEGRLTEAQARRALEIFRDYLLENSYDPDITEDLKLKARAKYDQFSDKAAGVAADLSDKAEEWIHQARRQAKKAADKLSDYLDDEKTEKP